MSEHEQYEHDLRVEARAAKIEIERLLLNHEREKNVWLTSLDVCLTDLKAKNTLILELADALENAWATGGVDTGVPPLIRKARKAVRYESS